MRLKLETQTYSHVRGRTPLAPGDTSINTSGNPSVRACPAEVAIYAWLNTAWTPSDTSTNATRKPSVWIWPAQVAIYIARSCASRSSEAATPLRRAPLHVTRSMRGDWRPEGTDVKRVPASRIPPPAHVIDDVKTARQLPGHISSAPFYIFDKSQLLSYCCICPEQTFQ